MAVLMRLVQQYHPSHKQEFHALEKQFVELEYRGVLPRGERQAPISRREAVNTLVWQCRFESLPAAEAAFKQMEAAPSIPSWLGNSIPPVPGIFPHQESIHGDETLAKISCLARWLSQFL